MHLQGNCLLKLTSPLTRVKLHRFMEVYSNPSLGVSLENMSTDLIHILYSASTSSSLGTTKSKKKRGKRGERAAKIWLHGTRTNVKRQKGVLTELKRNIERTHSTAGKKMLFSPLEKI